ncbi:MAG: RNA polymerase sigma factor WhiG [Bacillota bacterium]|nr:RNA polymerase sigma factor WhiG [Bacillota bacterium]
MARQGATVRTSDIDGAWKAFKRTGDRAARETLILHYAPLVKYVAGRLAVALPATVEFDDLISCGTFGLIDAVEKFEPARGVKFETYALARIRGAIIDGLRLADWVPRSLRQKAREFETAAQRLESRLGRAATDAELAAALGLSLDEYHSLVSELACTTLSSLDEVWRGDEEGNEGVRLVDGLADEAAADPLTSAEFTELKRALGEAIDQLPERERLVIALYYREGLTLKEIGRVLDVTEARVSQIHTKAILRLRGKLARWREDRPVRAG